MTKGYPMAIEDREELIYLLSEPASLEQKHKHATRHLHATCHPMITHARTMRRSKMVFHRPDHDGGNHSTKTRFPLGGSYEHA
jgi:hypothetical protein